jgi:hypothetical protein
MRATVGLKPRFDTLRASFTMLILENSGRLVMVFPRQSPRKAKATSSSEKFAAIGNLKEQVTQDRRFSLALDMDESTGRADEVGCLNAVLVRQFDQRPVQQDEPRLGAAGCISGRSARSRARLT